jgi:hypothetical protein
MLYVADCSGNRIAGEIAGDERASLVGTKREHSDAMESLMIVVDGTLLIGLAAVLSSVSALIWSIRRKT